MTQLNVLNRACAELTDSEKNIQTLFSMVLAIGEFMCMCVCMCLRVCMCLCAIAVVTESCCTL